jgi:hypothetical protein
MIDNQGIVLTYFKINSLIISSLTHKSIDLFYG